MLSENLFIYKPLVSSQWSCDGVYDGPVTVILGVCIMFFLTFFETSNAWDHPADTEMAADIVLFWYCKHAVHTTGCVIMQEKKLLEPLSHFLNKGTELTDITDGYYTCCWEKKSQHKKNWNVFLRTYQSYRWRSISQSNCCLNLRI